MRRRSSTLLSSILGPCAAVCVISGMAWGMLPAPCSTSQAEAKKDPAQVLLAIYQEVREFGFRETENFIKREFHLNLDGSMANREEHIVVLSHAYGNGEKMILQVTTFGENVSAGYVRIPVSTCEVTCLIEGNAIEIQESMFDEDESRRLFPEILKGIQDEKKLLKRLNPKR